jgi:hypothetical protein
VCGRWVGPGGCPAASSDPPSNHSQTPSNKRLVEVRKKVGAEKCEYVFDVHTSKVGKELKVVLGTTPPLARKRKDDSQIY